jgi:hypothetical protein
VVDGCEVELLAPEFLADCQAAGEELVVARVGFVSGVLEEDRERLVVGTGDQAQDGDLPVVLAPMGKSTL